MTNTGPPSTIPSVGDNFRRLHPEDEARLLREWLLGPGRPGMPPPGYSWSSPKGPR